MADVPLLLLPFVGLRIQEGDRALNLLTISTFFTFNITIEGIAGYRQGNKEPRRTDFLKYVEKSDKREFYV
ncbi:hypothetical protein H6G76_03820 [Nostoc sp. FACHB-152]|uniref:hypothetical protein n=1 Tax=unclassified Nostoc TaxID=2593658 RepID=UPI0016893FDC|nr:MULTISPECIES: hypothetical protein [unclassified Nostoc]MBD2446300.1 hypothetical protein [Nostoc sp. FACHB-152]MBD2467600.1 hypothetical protein [Nostoc sp. FACHB-145]